MLTKGEYLYAYTLTNTECVHASVHPLIHIHPPTYMGVPGGGGPWPPPPSGLNSAPPPPLVYIHAHPHRLNRPKAESSPSPPPQLVESAKSGQRIHGCQMAPPCPILAPPPPPLPEKLGTPMTYIHTCIYIYIYIYMGQCPAESPFWLVFQVFKFFDFP